MVLLDTALLHRIRYIKLAEGTLPHQRISHVCGGVGLNKWSITVQQAIKGIEEGSWLFCVLNGERVVPVVIGVAPSGEKYLKTAADHQQPNLLLTLAQCSQPDGLLPASEDCEPPLTSSSVVSHKSA
jgi:hypothetical protein